MKKFVFFLLPAMLGYGAGHAQSKTVPFNVSAEGYVSVSIRNSKVTIVGYDGGNVEISATGAEGRPVAVNDLGLQIVSKGKDLTIEKTTETKLSYRIKVPRSANVDLREDLREPTQLDIGNISGMVKVSSWVSKVVLQQISGPVTVSSKSGDVSIRFSSFGPHSASSISSPGRSVDVSLPAKAKADLDLEVESGKVVSDFDLGAGNREALTHVGITRHIKSELNGGGPVIHIVANAIVLHRIP